MVAKVVKVFKLTTVVKNFYEVNLWTIANNLQNFSCTNFLNNFNTLAFNRPNTAWLALTLLLVLKTIDFSAFFSQVSFFILVCNCRIVKSQQAKILRDQLQGQS